ncbi:hypothetical protein UM538_12640 [Staphylococcus aureus]|nr:hypothetical protein UM538_12640 [Staphylococcus aureus]
MPTLQSPVTYADGTTSTITVPVKHAIPEIIANPQYTVQGQDFLSGKGSNAADFFKLNDGSPVLMQQSHGLITKVQIKIILELVKT